MAVVDLGAAPGGWTEVVAPLIEARGSLVADLIEAPSMAEQVRSSGLTGQQQALLSKLVTQIETVSTSTISARPLSVLEVAGAEAGAARDRRSSPRRGRQSTFSSDPEVIPGYTADEIDELFSHGPSRVVAVDILPMQAITGAIVLRGDMLRPETQQAVRYLLPGRGRGGRADVVLCDMAHSFVGEAGTDTLLQQRLATAGWAFAEQVLRPGGSCLVKVRHGPLEIDRVPADSGADGGGGGRGGDDILSASQLRRAMQLRFRRVVTAKPEASRRESPEHYLLGLGFRGGPRGAGVASGEGRSDSKNIAEWEETD